MATGVANVVVPFFGGITVTGAIARTATNIRSGARTPVSGVVHAATLLAIVALAAPLASTVPLAALAAILVVVAYNMGEWREIASIVRLDNAARSVWFVTFFLTVVADLTLAVGIGMSLAALLYIYRVSQTTTVSLVSAEDLEDGKAHVLSDKVVPSYVSIVRIHGPFLFGTTETLVEDTADLSRYARPACARDVPRAPRTVGPDAAALRSSGATGRSYRANEIRAVDRAGQYSPERKRRARTGARRSRFLRRFGRGSSSRRARAAAVDPTRSLEATPAWFARQIVKSTARNFRRLKERESSVRENDEGARALRRSCYLDRSVRLRCRKESV
jgi:MFS superfamily sulfate permease-like transporter